MSNALQVITEAFKRHNLDAVTSFSMTEFPHSVALNILNDVIRKMNRLGNLWFTETKTALSYSGGVYQYSFTSLAVDPMRIINVRREATDYWGELDQYNYRDFQRQWRSSSMITAKPTAWSKFGTNLELNTIPDQDYTLYLYHYKDMPVVTTTTDTFLIPERDEDILIDNCYQMIGAETGRWDKATALTLIEANTKPFLVTIRSDAGLPAQMPAMF